MVDRIKWRLDKISKGQNGRRSKGPIGQTVDWRIWQRTKRPSVILVIWPSVKMAIEQNGQRIKRQSVSLAHRTKWPRHKMPIGQNFQRTKWPSVILANRTKWRLENLANGLYSHRLYWRIGHNGRLSKWRSDKIANEESGQ